MVFERPEFEVIEFDASDIITTSGCQDATSGSGMNCFNNPSGWNGGWEVN